MVRARRRTRVGPARLALAFPDFPHVRPQFQETVVRWAGFLEFHSDRGSKLGEAAGDRLLSHDVDGLCDLGHGHKNVIEGASGNTSGWLADDMGFALGQTMYVAKVPTKQGQSHARTDENMQGWRALRRSLMDLKVGGEESVVLVLARHTTTFVQQRRRRMLCSSH